MLPLPARGKAGMDMTGDRSRDPEPPVGRDTPAQTPGRKPEAPPGADARQPASARDGVVEGTPRGEVIDIGYTGDPDGDRIDAGDAILPGAGPDDDVVIAGRGDDIVRAGRGDDEVHGGPGDDRIAGEAGDDALHGGTGDDVILGGTGNDRIEGDDGDDALYGGAGDDDLNGGGGDDRLFGEDGDDTLTGGTGDDRLEGGDGSDVLSGNAGDDALFGGAGDDLLAGADGDDLLKGGAGDDRLFGGAGKDRLHGGAGNDVLEGGEGRDLLFGEADRDVFRDVGVGDVVSGGACGDDHDTLDLTGAAPAGGSLRVDVTGSDSDGNGFDGRVEFFDAGGNRTGSLTFTNIERIVPCFTPGTLIATPEGSRPVETLRAGDRVITRDNGPQEIRWIGATRIGPGELARAPHLRPVFLRAGALGNGLPERDMQVSPQHRVLIADNRAALYFEEREVLVAARHLLDGAAVSRVAPEALVYIHFMFDQHELVLSNGAWTESLQPGDHTLAGMGGPQRDEILGLFPELGTQAGRKRYVSARKSLKRHEALLLTLG